MVYDVLMFKGRHGFTRMYAVYKNVRHEVVIQKLDLQLWSIGARLQYSDERSRLVLGQKALLESTVIECAQVTLRGYSSRVEE